MSKHDKSKKTESIKSTKEFNTTDIRSVLNDKQMSKLEKELAELQLDTPTENAMPKTKDQLRKKVLEEIRKEKETVNPEDIQSILKINALEDINDEDFPDTVN